MNNDIEQFFNDIENAKRMISNDTIWFRGHSDTNFKLTPTILRNGYKTHEMNFFYDYKTHAAFLNNKFKSNWDTLLDMQHYGLPTRLLDWTLSLGTALFFALKDNPKSPCIWLLSPFKLNEVSTSRKIVYDTTVITDKSHDADDFTLYKLFTKESRIEIPFAIQPPHENPRIAAQRGMFTVQGSSDLPLEELCPHALKKIEIPQNLIHSLKHHLLTLGIDYFSLFPDHYGLTKYLINKVNIEKSIGLETHINYSDDNLK